MINDRHIMKAVTKILERSERQLDLQKIASTYEDFGILNLLDNDNNQIMYGRRGTGKTHILKKLLTQIQWPQPESKRVVYIDCRTLGSTSQFTDSTVSMQQRCISLFWDILSEIHNNLLEFIIEQEKPASTLEALDRLNRIITEPTVSLSGDTVTTTVSEQKGAVKSLKGKLTPTTASITAGLKDKFKEEQEVIKTFKVTSTEKVIFPQLISVINDVLKPAQAKLYILIDEWSSIPFDLQPYLAEFIKRAFLPNPNIVIKIAALEYRSNFIKQETVDYVGFELGSDISTALDIDDYFVYDRNPKYVTDRFSAMLFKHIYCELDKDYLFNKHQIYDGKSFSAKAFTTRSVCEELVRASEGVSRDLINIFSTAFFDAHLRGIGSIDKKAIVESARSWFEKDKSKNLDETLHKVLRKIVNNVIGEHKAKSFLLPRELEKNEIIQRLFDARVLHLMQRGYADKDNPGLRYNIYTLDYGTYVDLINTSKVPLGIVKSDTINGQEIVVPLDDKRSIRRIVLTLDDLEI